MRSSFSAYVVAAIFMLSIPGAARAGEESGPRLSHAVFFELKDKSAESREKLVEACKKYLSKHEGCVSFSVGTIVQDLTRDVNDRDFDVALIVIFKDRAAHDAYQKHERHLKFIEEQKDGWKKVRVFDSYLSGGSKKDEEKTASEKIPLPDPASDFAGIIRGKVESKKKKKELVLAVEAVVEEWEHSKAKDAKALVGKKVIVSLRTEGGVPDEALVRFLEILKTGDTVSLDVAHKKGEALTLLELTADQRKQIEKAR